MNPSVKKAVPILPATDVASSLAWWTGVCGFTESFRDATPPSYAGIARDDSWIHLARITDPVVARTVGDQTMVRIVVDDVTAFFAEYQQRGGTVHHQRWPLKKALGNSGIRRHRSQRRLRNLRPVGCPVADLGT